MVVLNTQNAGVNLYSGVFVIRISIMVRLRGHTINPLLCLYVLIKNFLIFPIRFGTDMSDR